MNTNVKILLATTAYRLISLVRNCCGLTDHISVRRGGIVWDLDLHEGIDFSIFLLGGFEPRTLRLYRKLLGYKEGEIILDIGANVGAHTLPLAQLVVSNGGKVYAFEPTDYAFRKLITNTNLNPSIANGIEPIQAMLVAEDGISAEGKIYSSWPLGSKVEL